MSLQPGMHVGPYEILSPLGAGGMGEVWKAKDARLDRLVAVKVLPEHLAKSPEALARFEREARAVAALNHPNITGIFDLGSAEGTTYVAMELLEGESVRTRLEQGPLTPRRATELAIQMAQGLAAAHEKGVVHRDLKPDNLWITREGRLKILDFGLAKQLPGTGTGSDSYLPTAAMAGGHGTEQGMILGTMGYMSPEQVRGEAVDARSDLFSFGVVLFEMLTGRRAFARATASDTMAAILRDDPPELEGNSRPIPLALRRIIDHCLEKAPERRFRDAHDVAFALENLSSSEGPATITAPFAPQNRRATWMWAGLGALLLVGVLFGGRAWAHQAPLLPSFKPLTQGRGTLSAARFLPSSSEIIYSARWVGQPELWYTRRLDQSGVRLIPGGVGPLVSVTGDGEVFGLADAFLSHGQMSGRLFSLPMVGGSPRDLTDRAWGGDQGGRSGDLASIQGAYGGWIRIEWPLGHPIYRCLNTLRALRIHGDHLAVFQEKQGNVEEGAILLVDRQGTVRELGGLKGFTGLAWGPEGDEVWVSTYHLGQSEVLALGMGGRRRSLLRHAGRLELQDVDGKGRALVAVHAYQRHTFTRVEGEAVDRDLGWLDAQATMSLTADGRTALLANLGEWSTTEGALYLRPLSGGPAQRISLDGGSQPTLSADGKWVATFMSDPEFSLVVVPTGPGPARRFPLPGMDHGDILAHLYPDGRHVFLWASLDRGPFRVYLVDLEQGTLKAMTKEGLSAFLFENPCSPDGKWLALIDGTVLEQGANPIVILHPDGSAMRTCNWLRPGEAISGWGADSASLLVWDRNKLPAEVERLDLATGKRSPVLKLSPPDPAGVAGIQGIYLSQGGKRYAYNYVSKLSQLYLIEGLR